MPVQSMFVMSTAALAVATQLFVTGAGVTATTPEGGAQPAAAVGSWEPTMVFGETTLGSSFVVDALNNTTFVWEGSGRAIKSVQRSAAGTWSQPEVVGRSGSIVGSPQVAADSDGTVTAVWITERRGFTDGVMAARRPAGSSWSDPVRISVDRKVPSYPADHKGSWGAADLALAVSRRGAVAVAWAWGSNDRDKPWRIQSAYRGPARHWGNAVDVTHARGDREPQVGVSADGTVVLLYSRQPFGHPPALYSRDRVVGAGWTRATTVAAGGYAPKLAVDRVGDAVVVFEPAFGRVVARYRRAGARWGAPYQLSRAGVRANDEFALAMNGRGEAAVAIGSRHSLDLVELPARGSWSTPVQVVSDPYVEVTVALNGTGDTFLGWGGFVLSGTYRVEGGAWDTPVTIAPDSGGVLETVDAQVAPNGDVVVMWDQEDMPLQARVMTRS